MKFFLSVVAVCAIATVYGQKWDSLEVFNGNGQDRTKLYIYSALGVNSTVTRAIDPTGFMADGQSWSEASYKLGLEIVTPKHRYYHFHYEYRSMYFMPRFVETQGIFFPNWRNLHGFGMSSSRGLFFHNREILNVGFSAGLSIASPSYYNEGLVSIFRNNINVPITMLNSIERRAMPYVGLLFKRDFKLYHGFYISLQYGFNRGLYNIYRADFRYDLNGEVVSLRSRGTHFEALIGVRLKAADL